MYIYIYIYIYIYVGYTILNKYAPRDHKSISHWMVGMLEGDNDCGVIITMHNTLVRHY